MKKQTYTGFNYLSSMTENEQTQWKNAIIRDLHYKGYSQESSEAYIYRFLCDTYNSKRQFLFQSFVFESATFGVDYWMNIANG